MEFERLVRFEANGTTHYGNLVSESDGAYTVQPLHGSVKSGFSPTNQNAVVTSKVGSEHQFTAPCAYLCLRLVSPIAALPHRRNTNYHMRWGKLPPTCGGSRCK